MIDFLTLLAQEAAPTGAPAGQPQCGPQQLVLFGLMAAVFYFILIRPQGKERKRRQAMIDALKKNDRVITVGGIVGTVLSVKDNEVTLKVDESSNTKITFTRAAIQTVSAAQPAEPTKD